MNVEFDDDSRRLIETVLLLTAAAGGKIVVTRQAAAMLGKGRLVITEDVATGDKVYEIVRNNDGAQQ